MSLDSNLISTIIGAVLTILGGFFATLYLQKRVNKVDPKKLIREKTEKIYELSNQLEFLFIQKAFDITHMDQSKYLEKYMIDDSFILKEDEMIGEMMMLAKL